MSVRETKEIQDIAVSAKEKASYNQLYATGRQQASISTKNMENFFASLESTFRKAEKNYNWAKAEKRSDFKKYEVLYYSA